MVNYIKWGSTCFILVGILLTAVGYMTADRAILTNFGLQIPLFIVGNIYLLT